MTGTALIQPIDTIKVRIQSLGEGGKKVNTNPFVVGGNVIKQEGFKGLYKGLDSAIFRQATYGTARLGNFNFHQTL